ncbi:MAG: TIGR01459 family HAD-type hydrolase [Geminicoccaceae bacterium]
MPPVPTRAITGLREIADAYDAFILDQWGVMHDGTQPLPGSLACIDALVERGKRIVSLSNSGRRRAFSEKRLVRMGFDLGKIDRVVTSGEANWQGLKAGREPMFQVPGKRCYLITRSDDTSVIDGLGFELVAGSGDANWVMLSSSHGETRTVQSYMDELAGAIERRLAMICANPDKVAINPEGLHMSPGAIAERYTELSGVEVAYVGKPHKPVYDACFEVLDGIPKDKICAVGDSLDHDILGGNRAGIDTVLCADGILRQDWDAHADPSTNLSRLPGLSARHQGAMPTYLMPSFAW